MIITIIIDISRFIYDLPAYLPGSFLLYSSDILLGVYAEYVFEDFEPAALGNRDLAI